MRTEAERAAHRFHEVHEKLYHEPAKQVQWEDMPEAYRKRLITTFEWLFREGTLGRGMQMEAR